MNASRLQAMSNGSAKEVSSTSPSRNVTESDIPSWADRSRTMATISWARSMPVTRAE
jgi:hypothetical protein